MFIPIVSFSNSIYTSWEIIIISPNTRYLFKSKAISLNKSFLVLINRVFTKWVFINNLSYELSSEPQLWLTENITMFVGLYRPEHLAT